MYICMTSNIKYGVTPKCEVQTSCAGLFSKSSKYDETLFHQIWCNIKTLLLENYKKGVIPVVIPS